MTLALICAVVLSLVHSFDAVPPVSAAQALPYTETWESGTSDGWSNICVNPSEFCGGGNAAITNDPTGQHGKVQAVQHETQGGDQFSPELAGQGGHTYCISALIDWVGGGQPYIGVSYNGASTSTGWDVAWLIGASQGGAAVVVPSSATGWKQYQATLKVPGSATLVHLVDEVSNASAPKKAGADLSYFDNLSIGDCSSSGTGSGTGSGTTTTATGSTIPATGSLKGKQTYLYTCFWKKQAVSLTSVKVRKVNKLPDAKLAGSCTKFDTGDPNFKTLLGKSIKVYSAPAEYKSNLVAWKAKQGKGTAFGTWTFNAKAVIVKKTTAVLPLSTVMDIKPPTPGQPLDTASANLSLTFPASDPKVSTLKVGSVIVSGITKLTPYGMMRKVTSVTTKPNQVTVETVPAQLTDIFNEATIDIHTLLSQGLRAAAARQSRGTIHRPALIHVDRHNHLSLCPTFPNISVGTASPSQGQDFGTLTLGGSFCLNTGNLQYQEHVNKDAPSFAFGFGGGVNLHLTVKAEGGVVSYKNDLLKLLDNDLIPIPLAEFGIPATIVPHVSSSVKLQVKTSGYVQTGFGYNSNFAAGLACNTGGCSPSSNNDGGFYTDQSRIGATVSATISFSIGISFLVDGAFGPGISTSVYVTVSGGTGETDCLKAVEGVKSSITLDFQAFKYKWQGSWDAFKFETPLDLGTQACVPKIKSFGADLDSPVEVGRQVTFTAVASRAVDEGNFHITIINALTNQPVQPDCTTGDTCKYQDTEAQVKQLILKAEITDSQGAILDTSDPVQMSWEGSGISVSAGSATELGLGQEGSLVVTAKDVHAAHWFINLFEDGTIIDGCADKSSCTFKVTHNQAGEHTYTANLEDGADLKVIGTDNSGVKLKWSAPTLELTAAPSRHNFVIGTNAALTLKASTPADNKNTFLKIIGSNGSEVPCGGSTSSCAGTVTTTTIGTVTYTGQVVDSKGTVLDSVTYTINWFRFEVVVALSGASTSEVPVGKTVTIEASATPNLDSEGYTLSIDGGGLDKYTCSTMASCQRKVSSDNPGENIYHAQVIDDQTGQVVSDDVTQKVTWVPISLGVTANPGTTVPVGQKVTVSMTVTPADPDFTVSITGGGGSYTCPAPSGCDSDIPASSTAQSITYTVDVKDKATGTVRATQSITITWQAAASPCPGGQQATFSLSASSGDPNSSFTAYWCDQYANPATAQFTFDGQPVGGPVTMVNSQASQGIQLTNASPGQHTVGVTDSAGGYYSATYTVNSSGGGGGGGGGGGSCNGASVSSLTASPSSPTVGQTVAITASTGGPIPQGCKLVFADYTSGSVGFIYDQFDAGSNGGTIDVPWGPTWGQTGCDQEGNGTCSYIAFLAATGTQTPLSSKTITVTWKGYVAALGLQDLSAFSYVAPPAIRSAITSTWSGATVSALDPSRDRRVSIPVARRTSLYGTSQ